MDASAERREDADAPVTEVVEDALDDDGAIVGDGTGRRVLIVEVLQEVLRRQHAEVVFRRQPLHRGGGLHRADLAHQRTDRLTKRNGSLGGVGPPERHLARLARRGGDQHAVVRDLLDAPGRRA